jgi:alpha-L-rhamnosidase
VLLALVLFASCRVLGKEETFIDAPYASDLRVEGAQRPLGVGTTNPRFSWSVTLPVLLKEKRAVQQVSYQIQVYNNVSGALVWESGRMVTNRSSLVSYGGHLSNGVLYSWRVRLMAVWHNQRVPTQGNWSMRAEFSVASNLELDAWVSLPNALASDCPWFRKTFYLSSPPKTFAVVHIASVGYHELWVNGKKVDERVLSPSVSVLSKRVLVNSYDVTGLLRSGENVLGAWTGPGWAQFEGVNPVMDYNVSGTPQFALVLWVDGNEAGEHAGTSRSESGWKAHTSSVEHIGKWTNSNFGGDHFNASRHLADWASASLDDSGWQSAKISLKREVTNATISEDLSPETRLLSEVKVLKYRHDPPKRKYVLEMENIFAGWIVLEMQGIPGSTAIIQSSTWSIRPIEMNMEHRYTFDKTGKGTFEPKFSYHEVKYVTVYNVDAIVSAKGWQVGVSLERSGHFNCSSKMLTKVYTNTLATFQGLTTGGMTVDCPHRERLGYGDSEQTAIEFAMNTYRSERFYSKRTIDWIDSVGLMGNICQDIGGRGCTKHGRDPPTWGEIIPHTAPTIDGGGGPAWLAAVITVPWRMFFYYGDPRPLEAALPVQMKFLKKLEDHVSPETNLLQPFGGFWGFLGDWLTPHIVEGGGGTKSELSNTSQAVLFNSCFYLYMLRTVARSCQLFRSRSDCISLEDKAKVLRDAIHKQFFHTNNNTYLFGRQTHYVLPLWSGVVPDEVAEEVKKNLLDEITQGAVSGNPNHFDTGQFGTWLLTSTLMEMGRADLLVNMSTQTTYPGYGYFIQSGYETWPEAWDVVQPTPASNKSRFLPSQMHGCYNGIGSFFQSTLGGIQSPPNIPGMQEMLLRPAVGTSNLSWSSAEINAGFGPVHIAWDVSSNATVHLNVTIPPNTKARLQLYASEGIHGVVESGINILRSEVLGVLPNAVDTTLVDLALQSGKYTFVYILAQR